MTIKELFLIMLAATTSLMSILGCVVSFLKTRAALDKSLGEVSNNFENLKNEVYSSKQYEDLKGQLQIVHQENIELKKVINELLTKIDRISRGGE